jgi:general secretion pathway protein A
MYLDFFDLQREPFQVTPDPAFFYLFPSHREALAAILYGVEQRKGFVAIIGEVGVGKTTILRAFLDRLDRDRTKVIYLLNADVAFGDLLRSLLQEFGIVPEAETTFAMENQLHRFLIEQFRQDRNVALIIDEAQNMPVQTMEGLRVLSNLETTTDKLLQIVFCGQPELEQKLAQPELRQLKQRIAVQARVAPLTPAESVCYIQHRLSTAGVAGTAVFDKGAIDQIVAAAQGIPRVINILCDNALATALGYQERRVTRRIAKEIVRDHEGKLYPL